MKFECHGHIIADGVSYADAMRRHKNGVDEAYVRENLKTVVGSGIGFYRDGGDKYMVSAFAKQIAPEYGLDYRTPIYITHMKGYYGGMYGVAFETMAEFKELVLRAKALSADFIKITVTGMLDFNDRGAIMGPILPTSVLREAVNIAKGEGFAVMAHCNGAENMKNAMEAGVSSIEHGFWPDRSVIDWFLQTKAVWVPTAVTAYNLIGDGRYDGVVMKNVHEAQKAVLTEAYQKGVLIASGSDCGAYRVLQGSGTLDEYALLAEMGIDPARGNAAIAERFQRS
ncbi:amidohydrolase family protein [Oscillospiraceae bacterium CM]|nr:amidohydrolase family protein [Oscillospiraceae bacterium CM]